MIGHGFNATIPIGWNPETITVEQIRAEGWVVDPVLLKATNIRRKLHGLKPLILDSALLGPANNDMSNGRRLRVRLSLNQNIVRFDCPRLEESIESVARVKKEGRVARKNRRQLTTSRCQLNYKSL